MAQPLVHVLGPPGQTLTPADCVPSLLALSSSCPSKPETQHAVASTTPTRPEAAAAPAAARAAAVLRQQARLRAYEQLYAGELGGLLPLSEELWQLADLDRVDDPVAEHEQEGRGGEGGSKLPGSRWAGCTNVSGAAKARHVMGLG